LVRAYRFAVLLRIDSLEFVPESAQLSEPKYDDSMNVFEDHERLRKLSAFKLLEIDFKW
jgi:hypothetical protein